MEKVSVVIPCYGSEKTIESVVDSVVNTVSGKYEADIILVNDGSPDDVWNKIRILVDKYSGMVTGIHFSRNFGQHSALMAGYREAKGDYIISMDDDGQSNPEEIPKLVDKILEGYDVVYARYPEIKQSTFRIMGSWVNKKMSEILIGKPKNIKGNSYNIMRRFVAEEMIRYTNSYPYVGGLVYRTTKNIAEVDIEQREREYGRSGYTLKKLIKLWLNGFTAFSEKPLRVATILGFTCAALGFVGGIISICHKLLNPNVMMGYSSLIASIFFVGGILMLLIGIQGEYIGRIYISINNAPQYVIKEKICADIDSQDANNKKM